MVFFYNNFWTKKEGLGLKFGFLGNKKNRFGIFQSNKFFIMFLIF